jgi:glycine cleavage system aminomethyltransferase T
MIGRNDVVLPSLQDGIDQAGSPVRLLWKPGSAPWTPEMIEPEYAGWRQEQAAWHDGVAIADLSHHMSDTFIEGPDAARLLAAVSANNYESFAVGQAKQFIPVAEDGNILTDGILLRAGQREYILSGVSPAQEWVKYHAIAGGYDVSCETDPPSLFRGGADPRLFRLQVQGPAAADLLTRAFGGPLPTARFFHAVPVSLAGRHFRALRHNMAGQDGYEFLGDWRDGAAVKEALLAAGEPLGLVHVGALAYPTSGVESGWIAAPVPAVYTSPALAAYRKHLGLFTFEGQNPLYGSYYSDNIEDYYVSPWELGYGRSISFTHDFIGRDALLKAKDTVRRSKVTLVFDPADAELAIAPGKDMALSNGRYRVEAGGALIGTAYHTASLEPADAVLSLAIIDRQYAEPGTEVTVSWGEHPGHGTAPDADLGFPRIRATVARAPYSDHARTRYRAAG